MNKLIIFSSIIIIFISYLVYNEHSVMETFKTVDKINSSKNQKCKVYPSENAIETFLPITDELFIGGSTNYKTRFYNFRYLDHDYEKGSLIIFNKTSEKIENIKIKNFPKNVPISPDGLDYYNGKLYIINHAFLEGERVEVIKVSFNPLELTYEKAFKFDDSFFGKFNSISVVNDNIFYISEYLILPLPLSKDISKFRLLSYKYIDRIKRAFKLRLTYLYKFDMNKNKLEVVKGSNGMDNNGVSYDRQNKILYLAQTLDRNIKAFQLDNKGNVVKFIKDISTGYALDNLYFDNKNKLLFAAIMGKVKNNYGILDPSQGITKEQVFGGLLTYDFKKSDKPVYTFLQNDFMLEISHGMIIGDNIYLSSFYDSGILKCEKLK